MVRRGLLGPQRLEMDSGGSIGYWVLRPLPAMGCVAGYICSVACETEEATRLPVGRSSGQHGKLYLNRIQNKCRK